VSIVVVVRFHPHSPPHRSNGLTTGAPRTPFIAVSVQTKADVIAHEASSTVCSAGRVVRVPSHLVDMSVACGQEFLNGD